MSEIEIENEPIPDEPVDAPVLLPADEDFDLFEIPDDGDEQPAAEVTLDDLTEDELRARLARAEKRADYERSQRVNASKRTWAQEALERFPYSEPETITASSRRSFLEQAKANDQSFRVRAAPMIEKLEALDAEREKIREEERAAAREEVGKAWGSPTTGLAAGPIDEGQTEKRLEHARQKRDLVGVAKALMDGRRV